MAVDVLMPVITEAGEEAVITAWFVDEGQACTSGQLIAEVQAEKVASEVLATADGYVVNRVAIGDPVPQDGAICQIVDTVPAASTEAVTAPVASSNLAPPIKASPAAKRLARELGVELDGVAGSGPEGRITEGDVRGLAVGAGGFTGLRAVIARNMRHSHTSTAPVALFTTVDFGTVAPSSITARVVKAAATVLADHPQLNGTRNGDAFASADRANVAVAIQTDEGLVAPVVADPAAQSIEALAETIRGLADRAASRTLDATDYEGGTFTVTNLGSYGIDGFTPIINLPQVAILGVGAMRTVPAFEAGGGVVAGHQMVLSLTFDHAFVDGAPAAAFLRDVARVLVESSR